MHSQAKVGKNDLISIIMEVDRRLKSEGKHPAHMDIIGGAALVLMTNWRHSCSDVDYTVSMVSLKHIKDVTVEHGLPEDFFRDDVRMFDMSSADWKVLPLPTTHYLIRAPSLEYILAMKCMTFRPATISEDPHDIWSMIKELEIPHVHEVDKLVNFFFDSHLSIRDSLIIEDMISAQNSGDEYSELMAW